MPSFIEPKITTIFSVFFSNLFITVSISLSSAGTSAPLLSKPMNSPLYSSYATSIASMLAKEGRFCFIVSINLPIASSLPLQTIITLPSGELSEGLKIAPHPKDFSIWSNEKAFKKNEKKNRIRIITVHTRNGYRGNT